MGNAKLTKMQMMIYNALQRGPMLVGDLAKAAYNIDDRYTRNCIYVHLHGMRARGVPVCGELVYGKGKGRVSGKIRLGDDHGKQTPHPPAVVRT